MPDCGRRSGPPPGRFNDEGSSEALRTGVLVGFLCRWCEGPVPFGAHGGAGLVCPTCDLAR